jgi:rubredoxin
MDMPEAPRMWDCPECGKRNKPISKTCAVCGASKDAKKGGEAKQATSSKEG